MGNAQVRPGKLSKKDVERLQRRFNRLAKGTGRVGIPEFQSMVEMGGNPFVSQIFKLFDKNGDNTLTLEEFNQAIEYFGQLDNQEEQYKCLSWEAFTFRSVRQPRPMPGRNIPLQYKQTLYHWPWPLDPSAVAFSVYDQDRDGFISARELYATLQALLGSGYPEAQLEQVVYNTMAEYDADGDNKLDFNEFKQLLSSTDLASKFALSM